MHLFMCMSAKKLKEKKKMGREGEDGGMLMKEITYIIFS